MSDLRSVDVVESDEIPASALELATQKRTELVEQLIEIDDKIAFSERLAPLHRETRCRDLTRDRLSEILAGFLGLCCKEHRRAAAPQ